jgi:death on curing protein
MPRRSDVSVSDADLEYLDVEDLVDLARMLLGDPPPIRDMGLLGSAAARPQTTVSGVDAYPDVWTKAAALLQSVVKSHPLIDGNKRLGWLSTAVFLDLNGVAIQHATNDDVYEFVTGVAAGERAIEEIAVGVRGLVRGRPTGPSPRT